MGALPSNYSLPTAHSPNHIVFERTTSGLILIEVLVALAITAIALTAISKAIHDNIRATLYLQDKSIAAWLGVNVMNQALLGLLLPQTATSAHNQLSHTVFLGQTLWWTIIKTTTPNKFITKLIVEVFSTPQHHTPLLTLESYQYHPPVHD